MKNVKGKILGRKVLSFVLTVTLLVGLMPGNMMTVSAEGTDTVISDELIVESVSSNDASATTECTCGTDDPAFHATNCPAYIAPENPQCYCAEKCTEDTLNVWCDVCGMQGVSACQGEDTAAVAKADGIMYTPKVNLNGTEIYMDGYDTYIVDGTNSGTTAVYYYDNNGNQVYVNPNGAAGDDLSEYKIYSNGETYNALSGDVNIEMTGGSVGSIVIGYYIYGSGNDRTNVNVNISGGSCGCVEKAAHYGNSWVFSEQIVPMNQELTGYVTKTDSGWVAHGDAIIPEGKTVTVGEGEVFQIESGSTLTNNGTIVNNGTINTYVLLNGTVTGNGTVVRNAICINDTASSITVYKDGEEYPAQTEVVDGKTYIYVPAGEIKVDMDGEVYYAKYSAEAGEFEPESEQKGVTDFTNMPTEIKANEPFTLSAGMVDEWFNTTVTYEISVDGGTGAVLDGNVLTAYGAGTIQVTVTAMDTYDYTFSKTYEIVVAYTPVSDIETVSSRIPVGINYDLSTYEVTNNDASYKTIEWSVVNANGTGATITDNAIKATSEGTATIRATVNNGQAYGTAYTKDYDVTFYTLDEIDISYGSIIISKKDDTTITVAGTGIPNGSKDYPIDESIRIIGSTTSNTITITDGTTANLILSDVTINRAETAEGATPIMVESGAKLNLTLTGDNALTACTLDNGTNAQKTAALGVPVGAELVITENSTGTLTANGAKGGGAGIGAGYNSSAGTITINGGTINATSDNGAGIGGGYDKSGDRVTRNGGIITINGGNINATSDKGAGIGSSYYGDGGTVIIKGGTVNATSTYGAGIGAGYYSRSNCNNYVTVTIEGGTVNATSTNGAGIGGGAGDFSVTVTINGGTINATSTYGAGIGRGEVTWSYDLTVTITGGNFNYSSVTAPTNGTSAVACYTSKFLSDSVDMAGKTVTAITLENGGTYGLKDVVTFDGGSENEGYFNCYLPAGSKITSITVGGTTYNCRAEDGTCYVEHTWEDATCTIAEHCIVCDKTRGEISSHNYVNGVCTICGMDRYGKFHIKTAEQLVAFAQSVNAGNKDADAVLDANIDMTGVDWTPICQTVSYHSSAATDTGYSGTFDGNGHTISNLTVTGISGDTYSYGLFGTVSGTVENLGMVNYKYTMGSAPDARAGSVAGQVLTGGTITNCYSVGHSITTSNNIAGGIAGCTYGGTISNCYALNGSVSGHDTRCGGVVGDCQKDDNTFGGTVSNCYTDDTQVVSTQNNSANITNCAVKDDDAFASGEIAYLLNGSSSEDVAWYQTLKTDTYPVPNREHGTVYSVFKCNGTTPAGYSNVNENEPHTDNNSDGFCDVCGGNAHIHEWTYTASNNTITAVCGAADCPLNGAAKTIVISASDKIYDGTAVTATVTNNADTKNYSSFIVYRDNDGDVVDEAVNAGTYTANLTVGGKTATVEFTIAKVTPDIGTVSASNMENTLDVSQVVLSRSNETVPGTLSLAEGTTLQYGIHDYTYVFTPNDNTNYETVTGTVSITISDTNKPTATYKVGTDEWKQFINTITFGHFCKDYTTVDITYSDEGSGVADKQYYISDVEITNTANIQWSQYTDTLNINATGKYYIYVRVTDNYGNVVIQNSEGIVVYAESVITPTSFSCEYGEENSLDVDITTNGNTFANLTDGSGNEIDTENYSIDGSTLTIKGEYLSDLDVGEYTYKICMNPQGVENTEATLAYSFVVNVTAKELTVTGATATSRDYIANDKTVDITGITLSGIQGTDDVSVSLTSVKGTLSSDNAGTYESLTLPALALTGADKGNYELVQPTGPVTVWVSIEKLNAEIIVEDSEHGKIFGQPPFSLGVSDNNPEAEVTYESNNEDVATVTSEGIVTIHKAGSALITVSLAESTNYISAESKQIIVDVAKKYGYTVDTIQRNYLYSRETADTIDLSAYLPADCGEVTYGTPVVMEGQIFSVAPAMNGSVLGYSVAVGEVSDAAQITVTVKSDNYADFTITVVPVLVDQMPVSPKTEVTLTNDTITYGDALSVMSFEEVVFEDEAGNAVAGTLAWKEPSATPNAGTTSAKWVFTPNNAEYASVEGTVAITVNKAMPNVTAVPTVADRVYNPSVVLADSDLTGGTVKGVDGNSLAGGWSWQTASIIPVVNNSGYIAVFTPTDSTNYETVTRTITVNVTKATPYVATKPTASALTYGQTLNQSVLSNGVIHYSETDSTVVAGSFAWEAGTVKPAVSDSATTLYNVLFTPDDSDNYKEVTVKLTVSVSKAEATALNNANKTYVYAESKNGESVSIEGLPEDCGSVSYEISSISDTNNMLENVSVDATGKLTYDVKSLNAYSNGLSATVTVTVSMQNYEDLTYTLTVVRTDKLVQNISAENISLTFGDNDTDIVVTGNKTELSYRVVDDSNENGDVVTVDSTGKVHIVNSGTATVEIKAEGSSSYAEAICEIQVTVAKRTVNVPAKDDTVYTYTGLPQTYSIASSPFYTIENTTQTNAGTYDVAVSLISDNYQWSAVLPEYKFVIKPAQVTITAESHTVKQGDELPAFTYITTGLVNGENLPITVSVTCSATNSETVGTYDIVVSGPANEGNYTYTYKKGTLEVLAEDEAPFIVGNDDKMGWDAISDAIEDAGESENIKVDMNGATVVPGDVIEEARDKGITISFVLDNGLTWTIDGSTVTDGEINNINFGTTVEDENNPLNNIPVDVINGVTGEKATIEVNLTYSGNFGFTAGLKANLGSDNAGYYANLYYYNPTTGKLEYVCADMIAANGDAELTFTHASDYLIVIDDEDLGKVKEDTNTNTNTGNNTNTNTGNNNTDNNSATTTPAATNGTVSNNTKVVSPDTGDEGAFWIWMLMLASLLGMAGAIGTKRVSGKKN